MLKVSDIIAEFLKEREMKHVFGIIGSGNAHIFDSIQNRGFTQIICVHQEQAACMAMQTYYRVSGTITASILTTGAGAANGITGVISAWADSIPGLVIASNENSKHTTAANPLRMWGIQGFDSVEMVKKVTKYAVRIMEPDRILYELQKAYHIASTGRPGPCWIDVPMNVQAAMVDAKDLKIFDPTELQDNSVRGSELGGLVIKAWDEVARAKRPVLWLGHGIRLADGGNYLEQLLKQLDVPILVSWAGIDMVDSNHPRVYGRAGVYGQRCANFVLQNSDCVFAIGTRLAVPQVGYDISELARGAKIIVVDIDRTELEKYEERYSIAVAADAGDFLRASLSYIKKPIKAPQAWISQCNEFRKRFPWVGPEHKDQNGFINSYAFMERLNGCLKEDQVVVTDMGTALLSGHQTLRVRPGQRLMTSTGLGEMGYGLPGAIGASFARNRGEVLCLNCDGGMMMNLQELQTIVHHKLPIKLVIFNNDGYLMIKHTQKALLNGRYSAVNRASGVSCPDFSVLAKAFGMPAFQIRTWNDFDRIIPEIQKLPGPLICEVFMDPEQFFSPKLSVAAQPDGILVSPPLEDLSPLLSYDELKRNMIDGLHAKSEKIRQKSN
ncbi:MAG TPA: thiamine pyrophosphate-binding protein [Elusimicrobiota bacterium]|nr:thiamine pyrophosphate-binding protein [Elusimicrobiota bacterium]